MIPALVMLAIAAAVAVAFVGAVLLILIGIPAYIAAHGPKVRPGPPECRR